MYLSGLEIVGFKSFAQKTNFRFTPGITAVVGPNGCGKTNVVDAIRWVLGEQKSAILRSEIMENVIFNGTSNRKPLGMAEVSMTIKNNKNVLPTDYREITIARRLFRDGDSQYLLNNTSCRLKDIVDLFMDTGVGADSYSVIELKMVEAILSGKPEERRHLLEAAAGVTKYKIRRKEASKKLAAVQSDLFRVQDIVSEVEKNVASLSRQAAKTRKYNKLSVQLKELELALLTHDYLKCHEELNKYSKNFETLQSEKSVKEKEIDNSELYLSELEKSLYKLDDEYQKASEKENSINSIIADKNKQIAVSNERISSLNINRERILKEISDSGENIERFTLTAASSAENASKLKTENETKRNEFESHKESLERQGIVVSECREELNLSNENLLNIQNYFTSLQTNHKKNELRKTVVSDRIEEGGKDIDKTNASVLEIDGSFIMLKESNELIKEQIDELEITIKEQTDKQAALQSEIQNILDSISQQKIDLSGKNASLEFLKGLIDSNETAKYLIKSSEWNPSTDKITLAESVGTDDEYRIAVEAALGEYAHLMVVNTREEAYSAFELLKKSSKGKLSFLCKAAIPDSKEPEELAANGRIFGWVSEIVRVEDKLRSALRLILGKTALVDNLETAISLVDKGSADYSVTLSGEIVSREGIIRGGSASTNEGLTVGKKERIAKLEKEISKIKSEVEELDIKLKETRDNLSSINLPELNSKYRNLQNTFNQNGQNLSQFQYRKESLLKNISLVEQNLKRFYEELAEIENENQKIQLEISSFEESTAQAREVLRIRQNELTEAERNYRMLQENVRNSELDLVKLTTEISNLEKDIERLTGQKEFLAKRIIELNSESDSNQKTLAELNDIVGTTSNELALVQKEFDEVKTSREFLQQQKSSLEEQITQYTADLSAKRKNFEKFIESIHQFDLQTSEIRNKIKNLTERAKENHEIELENIELQEDTECSYSETKVAVAEIKDRLVALGMVNFMALEEFESQSQRFEFYQAQVKDLVDSEKTLQETIEEINQTAEEKFKTTFQDVNSNFQTLFKKLFNEEGEAELKMTGDNWLESDIEIMAKPPGKKPHSIEMLSGGEKTLTSIALLFGIYMVKPSPFCILDEVDAPLDDANIDRFLNMIRDFSNNTQFMIVSHNKRTMEFADTLYGVTMQEEGVSKVVSVRLSPTLISETISN